MLQKFVKISTIVTLFTLPLISLGLKNQTGEGKIIRRGDLLYLSNTVVIKVKSAPQGSLQKAKSLAAELNRKFGQLNISSVKQLFDIQSTKATSGLDGIMLIKYEGNFDPLKVASQMKKLDGIEWAEPKFVRQLTLIPNDSLFGRQYYLVNDSVAKAWDVTEGDTSVVIGIVDTGVDWPHPDLYANIWHNWKDIKSNWANDTDAFKYDSIGWDFGGLGNGSGSPTPDTNPMEDVPFHGTLVAGVASAVTNNVTGVAGMGFKSKIMPVKAAEGDITDPTDGAPLIVFGFEGIKYAVDNGAKVINCSWGGGGFSNLEQETINYAVSKGALVVAAAGNSNSNQNFYPAAYKGVLSVAATDANDQKSYYSNYGSYVDVCAPGDNIYSTFQPNTYSTESGTSFASPQVAGLAALVFARFPNYTPLQVAEQIRVNCDNIDAQNPGYQYQLGRGRIDAFKAVSNTNSESVRAEDIRLSDSPGGNGNGYFEPGETISVKIKFVNYLKPASNLIVNMQSLTQYAAVVNGAFNGGSIQTLDSTNNYSLPFTFTLADSIPPDQSIQFKLNFSDGSYSDFQVFDVSVNPSYKTQSGNNISLTITGKGSLGFNDYPTNLLGSGFKFQNGPNFLFEGSLMLGTSATNLSEELRGPTQLSEDTAFKMIQPFFINAGSQAGDQIGTTIFNDDKAGANKLGVLIKLSSYTFNQDPNKSFIILKYSITNNSGANISNLFAGEFFDWDMIEGDGTGDYTAYDASGNLGYVRHVNGSPDTWIGTALISSSDYGYWAILNDGTFGFTMNEKWKALSSGIGNPQAGPGDISEVTSAGPFSIPAGQSLSVAFAIAAGGSLNDLRTAVSNARTKYQSGLSDTDNSGHQAPYSYSLLQNYPNPFNPSTQINFEIAEDGFVTLKVYDILGKQVAELVNGQMRAGKHEAIFNGKNFSSGVYFYKINSGNYSAVKKMILLK